MHREYVPPNAEYSDNISIMGRPNYKGTFCAFKSASSHEQHLPCMESCAEATEKAFRFNSGVEITVMNEK